MKKVFLQFLNKPIVGLLFRYGIVGVCASIAHFSVAYIAYEFLQFKFLLAHFLGFAFGLFTAYFGHYFYSFRDSEQHGKRFPKFLVTSVVALALHQGGAYLLVNHAQLDYSLQVLPLLVASVPMLTFLLNKFWVFSSLEK